MKTYFFKIFTIVLFLVAGRMSFAQDVRIKDPDADKFIGTWKHDSTGYSITITFSKGMFLGVEMLFGTYRVQKNHRVYEDLDESGKRVTAMTVPNGNPNELVVGLNDFENFHKHFRFMLTMQNGYTDRAILKLVQEHDTTLPEGKSRLEGRLLPQNGIVLIKQPVTQ